MSRSFKLRAVLRYLDKGLLSLYLKKKEVKDALPQTPDDGDENEVWDEFIQSLPTAKTNEVETDLRDINEMATEDGLLALLEIADQKGVHPQKEIEKLTSQHDQALYFFIHHSAIFDFASVTHRVTDLKAKTERNLRKRPADFVVTKDKALADVLKTFLLSKDGRGRECVVNVFQYKDRVCFMAYPEDFAQSPLCYQEKQLKRLPLRPTFEIVFLYYPETGKVELSAKGGPQRQVALFNIFNNVVLEDKDAVLDLEKTYRLEKFLDADLKLSTEIEDLVEYVRLTKLRLAHKYNDYRVSLDLKQANGLQSMRTVMENFRLNPIAYNVVQAEIKMKFPGKGRKGGVTIQLSYPDKCNLNDSPNHLKAKKYLEQWGLVNRNPTEKSPKSPGREPSATAV